MSKVIALQGLPGSGKTMWAIAQCANNPTYVRINKDDLRYELLGVKKGDTRSVADVRREERHIIVPQQEVRIKLALRAGKNVIVDDTNLEGNHIERLKSIAQNAGAEFEVVRFDTPLDECIARNAARPADERIPEAAIRRMATHTAPVFARYTPNPSLPPAVICDLDGTLALFKDKGHRSPYDASNCDEDELNAPVASVLTLVQAANSFFRMLEQLVIIGDRIGIAIPTEAENFVGMPNINVVFLSGRQEKFREPTERFLQKHGCSMGPLHMRATGDERSDWLVKGELFDGHVRDKYNVLFVLDDRNSVVDFWRSIGLPCFQVAPGSF